MSFIKSRKKLVSSAIASSLSVIAVPAIAQDQAMQLPTIHAEPYRVCRRLFYLS
nr:hypothetical protein [Acinetobacter colistiniresistens]